MDEHNHEDIMKYVQLYRDQILAAVFTGEGGYVHLRPLLITLALLMQSIVKKSFSSQNVKKKHINIIDRLINQMIKMNDR